MLVISEKLAESFAVSSSAQFREKLEHFLRRDFPEIIANLSDDQIRARIDRGLSLGLEYGMQTREDFIRFSYMYFQFGQDFETVAEAEWIRSILELEATGKEKLDLIERAAKEYTTKAY
jgi:hypothetical protein